MEDEQQIAGSSRGQDLVVLTAKRLDSDEMVEASQKVEPIRSEAALRDQLGVVVSSFYPEAEFRSYSGGAATYLAPKLLIVAVYQPGRRADAQDEEDENTQQQQLFAA